MKMLIPHFNEKCAPVWYQHTVGLTLSLNANVSLFTNHFERQVKIFNCVCTAAIFFLSANTLTQVEFHEVIHNNFKIVLQLKYIPFYNQNVVEGGCPQVK